MTDAYGVDITVHIRGQDATTGVYPVEATLDDGSRYQAELRIDRERLLSSELEAKEYGLALFEALFTGPVRRAYDRATGRAESETGGRVRVHLWIDADASELHALPWERLYHIHRGQEVPLATSALTPFSRYAGLELGEAEPVIAQPLRLFVAISNPSRLQDDLNLPPVPVEEQIAAIQRALGNLREGSRFQVTVMPGRTGLSPVLRSRLELEGYRIEEGFTTLENIVRALQTGGGCHVLHFVGHGHFRPGGQHAEGIAALYLEKETDGGWSAARDAEVVAALTGLDPQPRLVFLSACESARRETTDRHPFVGLGPKLVEAGVPAVVAMQDLVPIDLAVQLAADFYGRLSEHGVVDRAINEARLLLFDQGKGVDWAIPVLFMRLRDGRLFAPDPVYEALRAMQAYDPRRILGVDEYLEMPLEAIHVSGHPDPGTLQRLGQDPLPSRDLVEAVFDVFARKEAADREGWPTLQGVSAPVQVMLLLGGFGMARTTQLRRLVWATVQQSLRSGATDRVLPAYVDLSEYPAMRLGARRAIEVLILESLRPFWPGITEGELLALLRRGGGPILRVLFDGSDGLADRERRAAWDGLQSLAREYPRHEYVCAVNPAHYDDRRLLDATDLLVIQPMSARKVQVFLQGRPGHSGLALCEELRKRQLFDLAAIPWLLARMVQQARDERYPRSRAGVLQDLVEDAVAEIPAERGMQSRAAETLYALAWQMHSALATTSTVEDALRTAQVVRGNREYSLEELLDNLVQFGLLARIGYDRLRFAYPFYQSYCCAQAIAAMPGRDRVLDDITASLGRLARLRWWEDTLVMLSGLLRNPEVLLRLLVYGAILTEGEQVFLAVRCLSETRQATPVRQQEIGHDIVSRVVDALVWRLSPANEPIPARRARAAQALGQLGDPSAIPYLVRAANKPVRLDWQGQLDYEYSSVRMAAAVALRRRGDQYFDQIAALDSQLADLLQMWDREDIGALGTRLTAPEPDSSTQAIAAFALGDLQTPEAVELLVRAFLHPDTTAATRWAVTDALALLDPAVVTRRAILPLLDAEAASQEGIPQRTWKGRAHLYERLAYLIGKVGVQIPAARAFLDRCLTEFTASDLKARAMHSLGWLHDQRYKVPFEQMAVGAPFDGIAVPGVGTIAVRPGLPPKEVLYLRRVAIEALAGLGDQDTLTCLRQNRGDWPPDLEQSSYWTSQEISWRLSQTTA